MKNYLGVIGLLAVAIIWGGGFVASDIALGSATPFQIMTFRFLIATIGMGIIGWKQISNISKAEWKCGMILGSFLFAAFALQTIALQFTTPSKNAFLTATNVVFVPFIALVIYKKKIETKSLIGAGMAIIGAGVLSLQSDFTVNIGDSLTLLCAICFAFQIFLTGEFVGKIRPTVLNFVQMVTAFVLSLLGFLLSGDYQLNMMTEGVYAILYLGAVSTTLCYLLQTISQKYVDETKAAIILSMEAVFGTLFSILILHEMITIRIVIGSILILSAVLVSEIRYGKKGE